MRRGSSCGLRARGRDVSSDPQSERGNALVAIARSYGVPKRELDEILAEMRDVIEFPSIEAVLALWAVREGIRLRGAPARAASAVVDLRQKDATRDRT